MTNVNDIYTSNYLTAADLQGKEPIVTITQVDVVKMNDGQVKICIFPNNKPKGVVLNKTNARAVNDLYGPETDSWIGKRIKLVTVWTDYQGKPVQAIRIVPPGVDAMQQRGAAPPADDWQAPPARTAAPPPGHPAFDDEVPF